MGIFFFFLVVHTGIHQQKELKRCLSWKKRVEFRTIHSYREDWIILIPPQQVMKQIWGLVMKTRTITNKERLNVKGNAGSYHPKSKVRGKFKKNNN